MPHGILEVVLVGAKGLEDTDFLSGVDAYAILTCRTQEKTSNVVSGEGSRPHWNETFFFTISDDVTELRIKLMDKDTLTDGDFLGEAKIPLEPVFDELIVTPMSYNVVKDQNYCGEVTVGLRFTHQPIKCFSMRANADGSASCVEESFGGWKESSMD